MILKEIQKMTEYKRLLQETTEYKNPIGLFGLSKTLRAAFLTALQKDSDKTMLIITKDERSATRLYEDVSFFSDECEMLPLRDINLRFVESFSRQYEYERLKVFKNILSKNTKIVIASFQSALMYTMPKKEYINKTYTINYNEKYKMQELMLRLVESGYVNREMVEGVGQFSKRGDILDIFPPGANHPIRIEFWGEVIDRMTFFDLENQRRLNQVKTIEITPTKEVLFEDAKKASKVIEDFKNTLSKNKKEAFEKAIEKEMISLSQDIIPQTMDKFINIAYNEKQTVIDYLENPLIIFDDYMEITKENESFSWQHSEDIKQLLEENVISVGMQEYFAPLYELQNSTKNIPSVILEDFIRTLKDITISSIINVECSNTSVWSGEYALLKEDIEYLSKNGYKIALLAGTKKNAKNLARDLEDMGYSAKYISKTGEVSFAHIGVMEGHTNQSFQLPQYKLALITGKKLTSQTLKRKKQKAKNAIISLEQITKGDYVIHQNYGVGIYDGIHTVAMQNITKDYIKIKFKGADTLFVPVTQLDLISRYNFAQQDEKVSLSKLGTQSWEKTKQKAKKATSEMAKELISLYAQRQKAKGFSFSQDTEWQRDFEARFIYDETDDQLHSIAQIKKDMESTFPMDRLLCGDVGVGKTEVAIRAAFKAVMDSKQVAILVPTTVLAWQHFNTFMQRMESFPVNIQLLSRFRTTKQRNQTIKDINSGVCDIVIGTHALIQKSVNFKNLGLLVIDEEQRFGVAHKEKLVESFKGVDVLTLSATPIPRTLSMALNGIRDMSTIEEPPIDRIPIETYVSEYDEGIIKSALVRELNRSGQCYYLHNRVQTIDACANKIRDMIPDAVVAVAHGQMDEASLSGVWRSFINGEIDILVCTTIIETGIDVSNCNTLIIEDSDSMGLSQLYQIRGRVGRSTRKAYAYFTFRKNKVLSEVSVKRLNAIKEFTSFGSGFKIAMRDLEIRGAGSVLGKTQSGFLMSIGYDLYIKLLNQAIALEQGLPTKQEKSDCIIDISIDAFIPQSYIPSHQNRIEAYKKIAVIEKDEDVSDLLDEFIDRYSDVPKSVMGLIEVSLIRVKAANLKIKEIVQRKNSIVFYSDNFDEMNIVKFLQETKYKTMINSKEKPYLSVLVPEGEENLKVMKEIIDLLNFCKEN